MRSNLTSRFGRVAAAVAIGAAALLAVGTSAEARPWQDSYGRWHDGYWHRGWYDGWHHGWSYRSNYWAPRYYSYPERTWAYRYR